jgi:hypothetical protein
MRDVGYSLETALADVVDNSISAGARNIRIQVDATASPKIGIADDGTAMSRSELYEAMRLGSRNPLETRAERDLGRFGLGMKTASFSQCRRLTVVSRQQGLTSVATWDLDHVAEVDRWSLLTPDDHENVPFIESLGPEGTLVVWEKLDRAVEDSSSDEGRQHFIKRVDEASRHLELVFHRYLSWEPGFTRVHMTVNDLPLKPFDPFHSAHTATISGDTEVVLVNGHKVEITPFTLPHHRNVSAAEWEHYGGPAGYLKNQGFYLYRERRLIYPGTWFGLARQTEITRLARVRIDMPNALDSAWHVDVKKAWARPPLQVRERLKNIIRELGAPSRNVYTHRGRILHDSRLPIWQRVQEANRLFYRVNAESPLIAQFRAGLEGGLAEGFDRVLQLIGAGLPIDAIFADLESSPELVQQADVADESLSHVLGVTYKALISSGVPRETLVRMLHTCEPFRSNWERTEALLEDFWRADGA